MGNAVPIIDRDPDILGGTPCFRGTLVPFQKLLDHIKVGETMEEFLRDFPAISREMAIEALELIADRPVAEPLS
jgi:uncharacterized protein (DUF433 family)